MVVEERAHTLAPVADDVQAEIHEPGTRTLAHGHAEERALCGELELPPGRVEGIHASDYRAEARLAHRELERQQPASRRQHYGLGAARGVQFPKDLTDVVLHGVLADPQA